MAIKERYRDNIGYWFPRVAGSTPPTWSNQGTPFRYNEELGSKKMLNPMAGTYKTAKTVVYLTDAQLDFLEGDRISLTALPVNDVNEADFSIIDTIEETPYMPKGNRHRTIKYVSRKMTLQ